MMGVDVDGCGAGFLGFRWEGEWEGEGVSES
jgi:hypothetical protein